MQIRNIAISMGFHVDDVNRAVVAVGGRGLEAVIRLLTGDAPRKVIFHIVMKVRGDTKVLTDMLELLAVDSAAENFHFGDERSSG